jgi:hypothetical protein
VETRKAKSTYKHVFGESVVRGVERRLFGRFDYGRSDACLPVESTHPPEPSRVSRRQVEPRGVAVEKLQCSTCNGKTPSPGEYAFACTNKGAVLRLSETKKVCPCTPKRTFTWVTIVHIST